MDTTTLAFFFSIGVCYLALRTIYRFCFHPLAQYPSLKLAVAFPTFHRLYEIIKQRRGHFLREITRQHQTHGPVVRIGPNSLHVNDPDVYLGITKIGSGFLKHGDFYSRTALPDTSVGMLDPRAHRARHAVLVNTMFSPKRVEEIAWIVEEKVGKLLRRWEVLCEQGKPVNVHKGLKALAGDIVSRIALGRSFGSLDHEEWRNVFMEKLRDVLKGKSWFTKVLFAVTKVGPLMPEWMFTWGILPPPTMVMLRDVLKPSVQEYLVRREDDSEGVVWGIDRSPTIDALLDPHNVPKGEKALKALDLDTLCSEVSTLVTAGSDTVATALILGIYNICRHPDVHSRLSQELLTAFSSPSDPITYQDAKTRLPYMTACIKEILRISNPFPGRLPRVVPPEGFVLHGKMLPGGTVINTSAYLLNRHPAIWTEPEAFSPERWLAKQNDKELDKYMASFYRGTRACVGKELAWCEMYLLLANLFRKFEVRVHETSDKDMEWVDAMLIVFKGKNLNAMLKKRAE